MGGCFSSSSRSRDQLEAAAAYHGGGAGGYRPTRVRPSDEDGKWWPYAGERDVDDKAAIYIANFHRYQSGCCAEHAAAPPTPAPAPAPATA